MTTPLIKLALGLAFGAALAASASAQLLHDAFNGASIDNSLWQPSAPLPQSSMTESGGSTVFKNRGRLLSVGSLPASVEVTGSFQFTGNIHDQFQVVLRTNGATTNPSAEFDNGIHFKFAIESDSGNTTNQVYISDLSYPNSEVILAIGTFPMSLNTSYNFRITDDGTNIALYINDFVNPFLTATDSTFYGSHLGVYNREGEGGISAGSITRLDFLNVLPYGAVAANLNDNFDGSSIDPSLWQTSEPFPSSSISESGGYAVFENRGRLIAVHNYSTPMTITGAFKITGSNTDEFQVILRTDGTFVNDQFQDSANGFSIRFRSDSFFASDEVSIREIGGTLFSGWTGQLSMNTEYTFKIVDDGFVISVFLTDMTTPKAVVQSRDFFGNKFLSYNREQLAGPTNHQVLLNFLGVVPQPMQPSLTGIVSRKTHGSAGAFDVDLPQTGTPAVECRRGGAVGDHEIVFTFVNNLTSVGGASTTVGNVGGSFIGPNPNQYTVDLNGVPDAGYVTVTLNSVQDAAGNTGNVSSIMAALLADTTGDGHVSASDVAQTKSRVGRPIDSTNFRSDVNANGDINASDVTITKSKVGSALP